MDVIVIALFAWLGANALVVVLMWARSRDRAPLHPAPQQWEHRDSPSTLLHLVRTR